MVTKKKIIPMGFGSSEINVSGTSSLADLRI